MVEQLSQFGRCLPRYPIELLERARERVRQTPHGSRRKLRVFRLEVQSMNFRQQALRSVELALYKCRVEDQLRLSIGDLRLPPMLDLAATSARSFAGCDPRLPPSVDEVEALAVFRKHRFERDWDNIPSLDQFVSSLRCDASICFRMGSKFRCV